MGVTRSARLGSAPALLAGSVALAALAAGCGNRQQPIGVDASRYEQVVTAVFTGVIALKLGPLDRAFRELRRASELVPDEPSTWANLAVLHLRSNNLGQAQQAIARARSLSPPNSDIELIGYAIASRRGEAAEALSDLRHAIRIDPGNLYARDARLQELARSPSPDSESERERQLVAILEREPENLLALIERLRLAVKRGDQPVVSGSLETLRRLSPGWGKEAREALTSLERVRDRTDAETQATAVVRLENLLRGESAYQASARALRLPDAAAAPPLERFLRLPNPRATPAEPDTSLAFAREPRTWGRCDWGAAAVLAPATVPATASAAPPDPAPTYLSRRGATVSIDGHEELSFPHGTGQGPGPESIAIFDWNDDFRLDIAFAGPGGVRLFEQTGTAGWRDATAASRLPASVVKNRCTGAWPLDVELDSDLDLLLGRDGIPEVLQNNGDGTWKPIRPFPGVQGVRAFAWLDWDGDGDGDAALVDQSDRLQLFENERAGHYVRAPAPPDSGPFLALAAADADADGTLDLAVLDGAGSIRSLAYRPEPRRWETGELAEWREGAGDRSARLSWADLDNNGAVDLLASGASGCRIWLTGTERELSLLSAPIPARIFSILDLNRDGRLDLVGVEADGTAVRLVNRGDRRYHWQAVRPRARRPDFSQSSRRVNTFGVGGELELRAGLLVEKQPIQGPILHFGLGSHPNANALRILWPTGDAQAEYDLQADTAPTAAQRLENSCPWLFAWDGRQVGFVTDILWKSPLGLRINAQDTAGVSQTRDWVKVRSDQLAERDGFYDLRITAELWETHFFDHVALMAVDHPRGTEVFVDERFSIPQPALKVHTVAPVIPVARARDDRGRDVTEPVRARDQRCVDTFELGAYEGVTRDHFLELELPPSAATEALVLVGHGWVYPTNSSINVALSQGSHPPPTGLSIEVPEDTGRWVVARDGLGFPAGKTKTVLLDLTGVFKRSSAQPHRLRLRTNMEIYWDSLSVSREAKGEPSRLRTLGATSAELRYRGFSETRRAGRRAPELPEYERTAAMTARWRDLVGFHTRFGDVLELVRGVDDRYVIMNAGDELALRFPALPPPPSGWVRDFVFISDGWEKDGNFNTGHSMTVLPLPSHGWPEYNRRPGRLVDDPVYRLLPGDWARYHTRYVTPEPFRNALRPRSLTIGGR